jgi:hypothetical protein
MPIAVLHEAPGGTKEQYDQVADRLSDGKGLNSPGDWPVDGLISHIAGPIEGGWRVVDVWESEEAFRRFGEVLVPMLQEAGLGGEPQVFEVHKLVT